MISTRANLLALAAAVVVAGFPASRANAGPDAGVLTATAVKVESMDSARITDSRGAGVEIAIVCGCDHLFVAVGGFAAIGERESGKRAAEGRAAMARDVYDVHVNLGVTPTTQPSLLSPFASAGVDVVYVTNHLPDGSSAAGVTMGMNLRGGVFGSFGSGWFYHASAAYIGAIVPGTGDALDGVVLQLGFGKLIID